MQIVDMKLFLALIMAPAASVATSGAEVADDLPGVDAAARHHRRQDGHSGGLRAALPSSRKLLNAYADCTSYACVGGSAEGTDCAMHGDGDCLNTFQCVGGANDGLSCAYKSDCPVGGGACLADQTSPCAVDGDCGGSCYGGLNDGEACSDTANSSDCSGICEGGTKYGEVCTTEDENLFTGCPEAGKCIFNGSGVCFAMCNNWSVGSCILTSIGVCEASYGTCDSSLTVATAEAPSPAQSSLTPAPILELKIGSGPILEECEGDCDDDSDCQGDLVCYQRFQQESVPGCSGEGVVKTDYCCHRPAKYLFYIGNDLGEDSYGLCEGDCDDDIDCKGSLVCFERSGTTPVPGCDGVGRSSSDYCHYPEGQWPTTSPTLSPVSDIQDPTSSPTKSPIAGTLEPTISPSKSPSEAPTPPTLVPTTSPSQNPTSSPTKAPGDAPQPTNSPVISPSKSPTKAPTPPDPTMSPTLAPSTSPKKSPTSSPTKAPTLVPTISPSKSPTSVPTKAPTPPTLVPTTSPSQNPTSSPTKAPGDTPEPTNSPVLLPLEVKTDADKPFGECEGGCQGDNDCQEGLVCYKRGQQESVPGCSGHGFTPDATGLDYCVVRRFDYLFHVGNGFDGQEDVLGVCEGDCDDDKECIGDLICEQRKGYTPIPGCDGEGHMGADYCRIPDTRSPSTMPSILSFSPSTSSSPTISLRPTVAPQLPTPNPTMSPTNEPIPEPTKAPTPLTPNPTPSPTPLPINAPTKMPGGTPMPILPPSYYNYENNGPTCSWQGPEPLDDKSNVAMQFFAFGDTPYDNSCSSCNTCLASDGSKQYPCTRYDCILKSISMSQLPKDNTCTYEGPEYDCVKHEIIPYMNEKIDAKEAAFVVHTGDILKGIGLASNRRCQNSSFTSRKELFQLCTIFLLVPGDNDWNECDGYDITNNTDPIRELWRGKFANSESPFNQFSKNFPETFGFAGGSKPKIVRKSNNPEIYYFKHNAIAFFGLNRVARDSYISDRASPDTNAEWVKDQLLHDTTCELKSIVIVAQAVLKSVVYAELDDYFGRCSILPTITITGDLHPSQYCLKKSNERLDLTVEAFRSGPLLISVVRDPAGEKGDFFHVDDVDTVNSNSNCPNLV